MRRQFELNEQFLPTRAQAPLKGWLRCAGFAWGGGFRRMVDLYGGLQLFHRFRSEPGLRGSSPRPFDLSRAPARCAVAPSMFLFWLLAALAICLSVSKQLAKT